VHYPVQTYSKVVAVPWMETAAEDASSDPPKE